MGRFLGLWRRREASPCNSNGDEDEEQERKLRDERPIDVTAKRRSDVRQEPRVVGNIQDNDPYRHDEADPRPKKQENGGQRVEKGERRPEDARKYRYTPIVPQ